MVGIPAGDHTAPDLTAQVWRRSAGNPFFVRELTRLIQAQGATATRPTAGRVIETVRRRLARLPTDMRATARLGGRRRAGHRRRLLVACRRRHRRADRARAARARPPAGVVTGDDPPRFTHDLYRDAILDGMPRPAAETRNLAIAPRAAGPVRARDAARIAAPPAGGRAVRTARRRRVHCPGGSRGDRPTGPRRRLRHYLRALRVARRRRPAAGRAAAGAGRRTRPERLGRRGPHALPASGGRWPQPGTRPRSPAPRSDCNCWGTGRRPPSTTS